MACGGGGESGGNATELVSNSSQAEAKASLSPSAGGTSADGTTIPSAAYIIDKSNNVWTVSNGYIYKNNVKDPSSYNVSLLLWYGALIFQSGTGGQFFVFTCDGNWLPCTDPRIAKAAKNP